MCLFKTLLLQSVSLAAMATAASADPIITPIVLTALAGGAGVAFGVTTITAAVISVAATAATVGASYLLKGPSRVDAGTPYGAEGPAAAPINGQRNVILQQATPPRRIVYGDCRVGGAMIFQDNNNPDLWLLVALSDGPIEGLTTFFIGDETVPLSSGAPPSGTTFYTRLTVDLRTGSDSQAASTALVAAFPSVLDSNFRQRGVACASVSLDWGDDAANHNALWGSSIAPSFRIEGAQVVDPRTTGVAPTSATARVYSDNPALCIADALVRAWDMAIDYDAIDWQSVADAADDCDVTVTYNGASVATFQLSGIFESGHGMADQLAAMLGSCGGALYLADGLYTLRADIARSSVWTITDDDVYEIGEYVHEAEQGNAPNVIKARYADAGEDGVDVITPAYDEASATGEPIIETVLALPFSATSHSAQILAYRELQRARDGRQLSVTVSDAGLFLEPLDVVTMASDAADWLNGDFQVMQIDLAQTGCILTLRGYNSTVYTDPADYLQ